MRDGMTRRSNVEPAPRDVHGWSATLVEVRLRDRGTQIELRLRDDGRGFDRAAVRERPSLGLLGIEERARRLGGTVVVESASGSGTTLTVTVPRAAEGHA